jgi:hypothetical protein
MEIDGAAGDITLVRPAAAAPPRRPEQVELRRARVFGDHPPRDKEHHLASRKCRRESTPQSLLLMLQIFRSVVDDPVARAAPAPADIIDRPSSIVAPNQTANNNPLKRNGDVDHSRTAGSSRSVCSAQLAGIGARLARASGQRVRLTRHVSA